MYLKQFSTRRTPQSERIPGSDQKPNSAGGFAWQLDDWKQLERFLILGSEGGTYYIEQRALTIENAEAVLRCIKDDGMRVVAVTHQISNAGRAPKNDPALFVLAMCISLGDEATKKAAVAALPMVARTGTHLFHFLEYAQQFRGWGRCLRDAVSQWYNGKSPGKLAYQVVKYRQRDGWTHRDVLRLAHPKAVTEEHNAIYKWAVSENKNLIPDGIPDGSIIYGFQQAQVSQTTNQIIDCIHNYHLTREMIPTQFLTDPSVWEALLDQMPLTAMIRNLGNMSKVGLLVQGNWDVVSMITDKLGTAEIIHKSRLHPLSVLAALNTYSSGKGFQGKGTWDAVPQVVDALDSAFYTAFDNVEPSGKNMVLALDVSSSMEWVSIAGVGGITPRVGSAAMALVTASKDKNIMLAFSHGLVPITISPQQRLDDACAQIDRIPMGGTNCALPMFWAIENNVKDVDTFVIYTDSETWYGNIHPAQALTQYRQRYNPQAKLVVVGMVSNGFSIADPHDAGMLDVVGFDTATPNIISAFSKGEL